MTEKESRKLAYGPHIKTLVSIARGKLKGTAERYSSSSPGNALVRSLDNSTMYQVTDLRSFSEILKDRGLQVNPDYFSEGEQAILITSFDVVPGQVKEDYVKKEQLKIPHDNGKVDDEIAKGAITQVADIAGIIRDMVQGELVYPMNVHILKQVYREERVMP